MKKTAAEIDTREATQDMANALTWISKALVSPNEMDQNFEPANVVDGLFAIARSIHHLADVLNEQMPEMRPK